MIATVNLFGAVRSNVTNVNDKLQMKSAISGEAV